MTKVNSKPTHPRYNVVQRSTLIVNDLKVWTSTS